MAIDEVVIERVSSGWWHPKWAISHTAPQHSKLLLVVVKGLLLSQVISS